MKVSVEITLIPIKKNYTSTIKKFIKTIRDSGFKVIENPLSTQIYGDYDLLMSYLNREIKNVFDDKDHIIVQLKLFNVDRSNYSPDF